MLQKVKLSLVVKFINNSLHFLVTVVLLSAAFTSCKTKNDLITDNTKLPPQVVVDGVFKTRGDNSFEYNKYIPLSAKPVTVFYYIPSKGITKMPVLFSCHGAERSGTTQRNAWKYFAEANGFIVIAPQFSKELYSENDYQFEGIYTSSSFKILNTEDKWTGKIVESLFDYFKKETGSTAINYNMFGHSAGAQFVHRYLLSMPEARVNKAVAANAGSWTFPYPNGIVGTNKVTYGWPMSIMNTPFTTLDVQTKFFDRKLWIQLGQLDIDANASDLPKDPAAAAQGIHRLARGRFYYDERKRMAQNANLNFSFQKAEVADANHSTVRMVYGRTVANVTDISNTGQNCAFDLLFK